MEDEFCGKWNGSRNVRTGRCASCKCTAWSTLFQFSGDMSQKAWKTSTQKKRKESPFQFETSQTTTLVVPAEHAALFTLVHPFFLNSSVTQIVDLTCTHDRPSNENRRCLACQFHHLELSPTHGTPLKSLAHPQCFHLVTHHPHPPATCTTAAPPPPPPPPPPLPRTPPAKHRPTNPNANPFWRRTWACTIGPRLHPMDEFDPVH